MGREREMPEVKQALATTRLLTLTGAGGSGKTRLALEAARDLAEAISDGHGWWSWLPSLRRNLCLRRWLRSWRCRNALERR